MSSAEPLNFGRKIKDLKRLNKKGYSDLCAGLKISRERIVALEENEREPSDTERLRFANFYNLPPEELGLYPGITDKTDASVAVPASVVNSPAPVSRPYVAPAPPNPGVGNANPNYANQADNQGNFAPPPRPTNYGNNTERPNPGNNRPAPSSNNPNFRPAPAARPVPTGGSNAPRPPMQPRPPASPSNAPRPQAAPKPKKEKTEDNGEPKPVIKYTAEQLGDIESAYLRKQRDLKVPLKFTFLNGKEYTGVVTDFTPFTVHILESGTGEEVILRKLAMAYYRKADALDEAQAEKAAAQSKAEKTVEQPLLQSAESE